MQQLHPTQTPRTLRTTTGYADVRLGRPTTTATPTATTTTRNAGDGDRYGVLDTQTGWEHVGPTPGNVTVTIPRLPLRCQVGLAHKDQTGDGPQDESTLDGPRSTRFGLLGCGGSEVGVGRGGGEVGFLDIDGEAHRSTGSGSRRRQQGKP